jgi:hypothetical protein
VHFAGNALAFARDGQHLHLLMQESVLDCDGSQGSKPAKTRLVIG